MKNTQIYITIKAEKQISNIIITKNTDVTSLHEINVMKRGNIFR